MFDQGPIGYGLELSPLPIEELRSLGDLLDLGVETVQKMAGHASASTAAGYDRMGSRSAASGRRLDPRSLHAPED
jgi:hypothetical protein